MILDSRVFITDASNNGKLILTSGVIKSFYNKELIIDIAADEGSGTDAVRAESVELAQRKANKIHKCDLGHSCFASEITQEQYDTKKSELLKYIK